MLCYFGITHLTCFIRQQGERSDKLLDRSESSIIGTFALH